MIRREILKEVLLDNRNEVVKHQVIPRSFQFEEFGNYVFVGIRRAGKSFLLYQRIQKFRILMVGTSLFGYWLIINIGLM